VGSYAKDKIMGGEVPTVWLFRRHKSRGVSRHDGSSASQEWGKNLSSSIQGIEDNKREPAPYRYQLKTSLLNFTSLLKFKMIQSFRATRVGSKDSIKLIFNPHTGKTLQEF
jgi:hypothetical protein